MKLVKVKQEFYDMCVRNGIAEELMFNESGRPCVLIVKLTYKNNKFDFVIPLRSNISNYTPKEQYFALPPNAKTKAGHHHGIHYIKLFPISKKYINTYLIDKNDYYLKLMRIIDKNSKTIISECQQYLNKCSIGNKHKMTPNIDGIIKALQDNN